MQKSFTHTGAAGDMIYGLAAMKRLGPGYFSFDDSKARNESSKSVNMMDLIEYQPYFNFLRHTSTEEFLSDEKLFEEINLDKFRDTPADTNILLRHFRAFDIDEKGWNKPWLKATSVKFLDYMDYQLVSCTDRYKAGNWSDKQWDEKIQSMIDGSGWNVFFIGTQDEHVGPFKRLQLIPTENAFELACLIKQSSSIVCNESLPLAIARGLGHNDIQLVCADGYDHQLWHTNNETYLNR